MSVSARLKLSAVTGTALLARTCGTGCAWANVAKPTEASSTRPIFRNGTRIERLSILGTSGPPHSYIILAFIVPMIYFRLQLLLDDSFGNDTGVAQVSHRDNRSYRFGLLFVWPRTGLYSVFALRRMHAAISRAAGVGGTSARVSSEISIGVNVSRTGMTTKSGYRSRCSRRKRPGNVQTKPRDRTISNAAM